MSNYRFFKQSRIMMYVFSAMPPMPLELNFAILTHCYVFMSLSSSNDAKAFGNIRHTDPPAVVLY